ncbi:hypothetical protein Bca4012_072141 [Brassica carinata]|uniref:Trimethylguanosine synthase n=1 Tax=Brassica carinata TaxID=52824 RepID=A0A8X7QGQ4_BRACI|nr:hypothetical protein Bca52824_064545 [Brassica carinata]
MFRFTGGAIHTLKQKFDSFDSRANNNTTPMNVKKRSRLEKGQTLHPVKVELAMSNKMVYGVGDRVDFVGDFLFLAPPWGGPMYNKVETYTMDMLQPIDGYKLFQIAQSITPNMITFLRGNVDLGQVESSLGSRLHL